MNAKAGSNPIPRWRADPDYFAATDPRRTHHLDAIDVQRRINARIVASAGDHSYAVVVHSNEVVQS